MHYLISDLHLGHGEIIDVYDRPFDNEKEMSRTLIDNWNQTVEENDEVLFLGDLGGPDAEEKDVWEWWAELNGLEKIVRGNHEPFPHSNVANTKLPLVERTEFEYEGLQFQCVHKPSALSPEHEGWGIYGHVHDDKVDVYPFIDPEKRRINVSAEILHYHPIPMKEIYGYILDGQLYQRRPDFGDSFSGGGSVS